MSNRRLCNSVFRANFPFENEKTHIQYTYTAHTWDTRNTNLMAAIVQWLTPPKSIRCRCTCLSEEKNNVTNPRKNNNFQITYVISYTMVRLKPWKCRLNNLVQTIQNLTAQHYHRRTTPPRNRYWIEGSKELRTTLSMSTVELNRRRRTQHTRHSAVVVVIVVGS